MNKITFEELPQVVTQLVEKFGILTNLLRETLSVPQQESSRHLLTVDDVAKLLNKSTSTIYAMTSEKRIPYHKQGNKLYFFEDEIIDWVINGKGSEADKEQSYLNQLEELRKGKKRKPSSFQPSNSQTR